jgi:uncharacterized membrane protein required for colicin V production
MRGDDPRMNGVASAISWPDIVIAIVLLVTTLRGIKRGMIGELKGLVALAFGIAAAASYGGTFDGFVRDHSHLAAPTAHVIGMFLYGILAYAIVYVVGAALQNVAKLPLLNIANTILGGVVGLVKGAIYSWAILYVALFFPLPNDVRADLHRSQLVAMLQIPDAWLDAQVRNKLPDFMRPYGEPILNGHRV